MTTCFRCHSQAHILTVNMQHLAGDMRKTQIFFCSYVVSGTENKDLGFSEADKALSAEFQSVLECVSLIMEDVGMKLRQMVTEDL